MQLTGNTIAHPQSVRVRHGIGASVATRTHTRTLLHLKGNAALEHWGGSPPSIREASSVGYCGPHIDKSVRTARRRRRRRRRRCCPPRYRWSKADVRRRVDHKAPHHARLREPLSLSLSLSHTHTLPLCLSLRCRCKSHYPNCQRHSKLWFQI